MDIMASISTQKLWKGGGWWVGGGSGTCHITHPSFFEIPCVTSCKTAPSTPEQKFHDSAIVCGLCRRAQCSRLTRLLFFRCICKRGTKGKRCEFRRNPCRKKPCRNGGKCVLIKSGKYRCALDNRITNVNPSSTENFPRDPALCLEHFSFISKPTGANASKVSRGRDARGGRTRAGRTRANMAASARVAKREASGTTPFSRSLRSALPPHPTPTDTPTIQERTISTAFIHLWCTLFCFARETSFLSWCLPSSPPQALGPIGSPLSYGSTKKYSIEYSLLISHTHSVLVVEQHFRRFGV